MRSIHHHDGSDGSVGVQGGYFSIWTTDKTGNRQTCILVVRDPELARELAVEYSARQGLSIEVVADYASVGKTGSQSLN